MTLHGAGHSAGDLEALATAFVRDRLRHDPGTGRVGDPAALAAALAGGITDAGLGTGPAWARFTEVVAPANLSLDSSRFLAFIPVSPSVAITTSGRPGGLLLQKKGRMMAALFSC